MFLIDYLFYRLATWFYKEDGPTASRAGIVVSFMQFCIFYCLSYFIFCLSMGNTKAGDNWLQQHHKAAISYITMAWLAIAFTNHRYYKVKF